jgi:5-formyltetrahydrofolate cyclo-ligase
MNDLDIGERKNRLRRQVLRQRDQLDPLDRIEMSIAAGEHAAEVLVFDPGAVVSGFWPIRSEIDPRPLMSALQQKGARLCLPVVMDKTTIIFRQLLPGAPLVETGFSTAGPGPGAEVLNPQIILVPLSAFDRHGGRLGYGAGFYDRAIEKICASGIQPLLAGFAFSCQEVKLVPMEAHDQRLNMIFTERGLSEIDKLKENK